VVIDMQTGNNHSGNTGVDAAADLRRVVNEVVGTTPVIDMHTHLFPPIFSELSLWGIDELLTYHYLVAELFRSNPISPRNFWKLQKCEQADLIWRALFVENSPVSEATRGVITVLSILGLDTRAADLSEARQFFAARDLSEHLDRVLETAGVSDIVMTNDPFGLEEVEIWDNGVSIDPRFHAALRMDRLLNSWPKTADRLTHLGYSVDVNMSGETISEIRRFLDKWIQRMKPLYMAVSLPDDFQFPAGDVRNRIINEVVLPTARDNALPFAMMIGVRRNVNPELRAAGDGVGRADVGAIERICVENPDVRFLTSLLSRENQHELCVAARKFGNLMPFGCWWFLNNPSIVAEITTERLELLGTSFIPQHSDARVLEQLIYKWQHSRRVIADCLYTSYEQLVSAGRPISRREIELDVQKMFAGNFEKWVQLPVFRNNGSTGLPYENGEDVSFSKSGFGSCCKFGLIFSVIIVSP
jgi:hypothetical protein